MHIVKNSNLSGHSQFPRLFLAGEYVTTPEGTGVVAGDGLPTNGYVVVELDSGLRNTFPVESVWTADK